MVNFILQYGLLEDKSQKPHECEWCGDNFGGRKRKYCSVACREEEANYIKNKRKLERAKKRQEKRLLEERAKRDKRIAALDRELEKLRKENRELKCVVCDKELTGNQTLYCSDKCLRLDTMIINDLVPQKVFLLITLNGMRDIMVNVMLKLLS